MISQHSHRQARAVPDDAATLGLAASPDEGSRPGNGYRDLGAAPTGRSGLAADLSATRHVLPAPPAASGHPHRGAFGGLVRALGGRPFDGERKISTQLARLVRRDPRWRYLSAVPAGVYGAHIDHLVVGPGGVYTVDARSHPNSQIWVRGNVFRVDGAAYPYVSNSRHEALRAARCLSAACGFGVEVAGVIAVAGPEEFSVREPAADVHVVEHTALRSWLRARGPVLDPPTLAAVYDAARHASTWDPQS